MPLGRLQVDEYALEFVTSERWLKIRACNFTWWNFTKKNFTWWKIEHIRQMLRCTVLSSFILCVCSGALTHSVKALDISLKIDTELALQVGRRTNRA